MRSIIDPFTIYFISIITTCILIYLSNTLYLLLISRISHLLSYFLSLAIQTSRRRYSPKLNDRFPRVFRGCNARGRWLAGPDREMVWEGGEWKTGAETPDAGGRRAPAVLDSGQRPRCLPGEMTEKGNRAKGHGERNVLILATYFLRYSGQVRPVAKRKKKVALSNGRQR